MKYGMHELEQLPDPNYMKCGIHESELLPDPNYGPIPNPDPKKNIKNMMTISEEDYNYFLEFLKTFNKETKDLEKLKNKNDKLKEVLHNARVSLVALGGDSSDYDYDAAEKYGVDMVQWVLLQEIDNALKNC